ncbi:MAG: putative thioredoxin [Frankiaceae bacterium]|jgi:putative thioredoxin|nr:putative thioredoxin [Frankiaceae bacterium]
MKPTSFGAPGAPPAQPAHAANVIDVSEATFADDVIERSRTVPVVIDLWAEWCAPCRQLGPVLERLAAEGNGSWVLAKVDVDANPRIAQALQVQGIPAVKAIVNGELVDEFTGAMPEPQVRQWLERLGVGAAAPAEPGAPPADARVEAARAAERAGDLDAAAAAYRAVLADAPGDKEAQAGLTRAELVTRAKGADEGALRARLDAAPDDLDAALALADLDVVRGNARQAFGRLVDLVRRTSGAERDKVRAHLVRLFEALPSDDPAVVNGRRELANALF